MTGRRDVVEALVLEVEVRKEHPSGYPCAVLIRP